MGSSKVVGVFNAELPEEFLLVTTASLRAIMDENSRFSKTIIEKNDELIAARKEHIDTINAYEERIEQYHQRLNNLNKAYDKATLELADLRDIISLIPNWVIHWFAGARNYVRH